jgi:hypothetical protein
MLKNDFKLLSLFETPLTGKLILSWNCDLVNALGAKHICGQTSTNDYNSLNEFFLQCGIIKPYLSRLIHHNLITLKGGLTCPHTAGKAELSGSALSHRNAASAAYVDYLCDCLLDSTTNNSSHTVKLPIQPPVRFPVVVTSLLHREMGS